MPESISVQQQPCHWLPATSSVPAISQQPTAVALLGQSQQFVPSSFRTHCLCSKGQWVSRPRGEVLTGCHANLFILKTSRQTSRQICLVLASKPVCLPFVALQSSDTVQVHVRWQGWWRCIRVMPAG